MSYGEVDIVDLCIIQALVIANCKRSYFLDDQHIQVFCVIFTTAQPFFVHSTSYTVLPAEVVNTRVLLDQVQKAPIIPVNILRISLFQAEKQKEVWLLSQNSRIQNLLLPLNSLVFIENDVICVAGSAKTPGTSISSELGSFVVARNDLYSCGHLKCLYYTSSYN